MQPFSHTNATNLALLCRHDHGAVHRSGWHMRSVEHQRFEITTPSGTTLRSQRHGSVTSIVA